MKQKFIFLCLISISALSAEMLNYNKVLSNLKGIKYYQQGEFDKSAAVFEENSIQHPDDPRLHFNQGNALYKKGDLERAEQSYSMALRNPEFKERSLALQNLGNVKFQQQDYKNAIKHYREALIEDPNNPEARYNYELASRMLQQQQQQQNNQQQQDKNKEEKKENEEQQQQQQNQQQQQQKQNDEKKEQQNKEKNNEKSPQEEQKSEKLKAEEKKKEDAEKILKALLQKEKEEMKKEKQKMSVDKAKSGKYW